MGVTAPFSVVSPTLPLHHCYGTGAALCWWRVTPMLNSYIGKTMEDKIFERSHEYMKKKNKPIPFLEKKNAFSTVPQISLPHPSTWSGSSPRHPAWCCAWAFLLVHQPTLETRCSSQSSTNQFLFLTTFIHIFTSTLFC